MADEKVKHLIFRVRGGPGGPLTFVAEVDKKTDVGPVVDELQARERPVDAVDDAFYAMELSKLDKL